MKVRAVVDAFVSSPAVKAVPARVTFLREDVNDPGSPILLQVEVPSFKELGSVIKLTGDQLTSVLLTLQLDPLIWLPMSSMGSATTPEAAPVEAKPNLARMDIVPLPPPPAPRSEPSGGIDDKSAGEKTLAAMKAPPAVTGSAAVIGKGQEAEERQEGPRKPQNLMG